MDGDVILLPDGRGIPRAALQFSASRSGGPGGQHVNTSATRVEVRVAVEDLPLTAAEKRLVRERLAARVGADDALRVVASGERSQLQNRLDAERRLARLVAGAIRTVAPRVPTRPSRAARARRLADKAHRARRKAQRRARPDAEDG
ncbi:MAG: peptide chain release factor-like protein [Actinomycetota bacterium]